MGEWPKLEDYRFVESDLSDDSTEIYCPSSKKPVYREYDNTKESENAAEQLYTEVLGYSARNISQKFNQQVKEALDVVPTDVVAELQARIIENTDVDAGDGEKAIQRISSDGIPDLFVYSPSDSSHFQFVEVKKAQEPLGEEQIEWQSNFDFLSPKILRVDQEFEPVTDLVSGIDEPNVEDDSDPVAFEKWAGYYNRRPKTDNQRDDPNQACLVQMVQHGLKEATGYNTKEIRSLNKDVLAAAIGAFRGEKREYVEALSDDTKPFKPELKAELEAEFINRFGKDDLSPPVVVRGSIGGISGEICAMLQVVHGIDPLEATKRHTDREIR